MTRVGSFLLVVLLWALPARAEIITLDFNEFAPTFSLLDLWGDESSLRRTFDEYASSGIVLNGPVTLMQSDFANLNHEANFASVSGRANPLVAVNGTGIMRPQGESGHFTMRASDGGSFSVLTMQLLMGFDGGEMGATEVTFEGYRAGARVGSIDVPLNWNAPIPGTPANQALGWTNASLDALGDLDMLVVSGLPTTAFNAPPGVPAEHYQNSAEFWVDDIRLHRVPEPGTFLLVGLGAAGAAWVRRRRA